MFSCSLWLSLKFYREFLQHIDAQCSPIAVQLQHRNNWELLNWQVPELLLSLLTFGVWTVWFHYTGFQQTFFSWSPDEKNVTWMDQILLFCHTFYITQNIGLCFAWLLWKQKAKADLLIENELHITKMQTLCFQEGWIFFKVTLLH